ncbi:MAG: 50S ribosomal protein L17 [Patescibacteria group bacterium]
MRHLRKGRKLGRVRSQRRALFKTLLGSLIMREKIETTEAKAKEAKGKIDKIITTAKKIKMNSKKLSAIRALKRELPEQAVKKLSGEFSDKFSGRNSGYARIIKLNPRKSDGARMAIIEFVD